MRHTGRTLGRSVRLTAVLLMAPVTAYAVTVSGGSGSGEQHRYHSYSNGADVTGTLQSTTGNTVYLQGDVDLSGCSDVTVGRYSTNTSSRSAVAKGGTISTSFYWPCSLQGVRSKVCRDISSVPDTCGPWSTRY